MQLTVGILGDMGVALLGVGTEPCTGLHGADGRLWDGFFSSQQAGSHPDREDSSSKVPWAVQTATCLCGDCCEPNETDKMGWRSRLGHTSSGWEARMPCVLQTVVVQQSMLGEESLT